MHITSAPTNRYSSLTQVPKSSRLPQPIIASSKQHPQKLRNTSHLTHSEDLTSPHPTHTWPLLSTITKANSSQPKHIKNLFQSRFYQFHRPSKLKTLQNRNPMWKPHLSTTELPLATSPKPNQTKSNQPQAYPQDHTIQFTSKKWVPRASKHTWSDHSHSPPCHHGSDNKTTPNDSSNSITQTTQLPSGHGAHQTWRKMCVKVDMK